MVVELDIYGSDIDFAGVVSNTVYLRWSEIWRTEFLARLGLTLTEMVRTGLLPTVVRHEVNYRRSMRLGQRVRMEGWVEAIGNSSVSLWLEMRDAGTDELACENRQVIVMVDGKTGESTPIPSGYREKLAAMRQGGPAPL